MASPLDFYAAVPPMPPPDEWVPPPPSEVPPPPSEWGRPAPSPWERPVASTVPTPAPPPDEFGGIQDPALAPRARSSAPYGFLPGGDRQSASPRLSREQRGTQLDPFREAMGGGFSDLGGFGPIEPPAPVASSEPRVRIGQTIPTAPGEIPPELLDPRRPAPFAQPAGGHGGGVPRGPKLPGELSEYGGFYFGEGYLEDLDAALSAGKITEAQAADLRKRYEVSPQGREAQIAREAGVLEVERGERTAEAHREAMAEQKEIRRREQEMHEAYFAEHQRQVEQYKTAAAEMAATRIDPNRFWNEASTGQKILAALSVGLGAAGASMTGGPNTAMNIIDSAISRDIAAQETDLETKKSGVSAQYSLLGMMRQHFGDKQEAVASARAYAYQRLADQVALYKAQVYPEEVRLRSELMETSFRQKAAAEEKLMQQRAAAAASARINAARKAERDAALNEMYAKMGLPPLASMDKGELATYYKAHGLTMDDRKVSVDEDKAALGGGDGSTGSDGRGGGGGLRLITIDGQTYATANKDEWSMLSERILAKKDLDSLADEFRAIISESGFGPENLGIGQLSARAGSIRGQLIEAAAKAAGDAKMSDSDRAAREKRLLDPTNFGTTRESALAALNAETGRANVALGAALQTATPLYPAKVSTVEDSRGNLRPRTEIIGDPVVLHPSQPIQTRPIE